MLQALAAENNQSQLQDILWGAVTAFLGGITFLGFYCLCNRCWHKDKSIAVKVAPMVGSWEAEEEGVQFIKYEMLSQWKLVGGGKFGQVKSAILKNRGKSGQEVAVKYVADELAAIRESKLSALIGQHPNIVFIFGRTVDPDGKHGLVMPYYKMGSLREYLYGRNKRDGNFKLIDKLYMFYDAACGLSHIHSRGVAHRDIAARNLLLYKGDDFQYHLCITDFGMSSFLNEPTKETKKMVRPLKWMSPERLKTRAITTTKCDVYSYAMTVWEILHEEIPYKGRQPGPVYKEVVENNLRPTFDCHAALRKFEKNRSKVVLPSASTENVKRRINKISARRYTRPKLLIVASGERTMFSNISEETTARVSLAPYDRMSWNDRSSWSHNVDTIQSNLSIAPSMTWNVDIGAELGLVQAIEGQISTWWDKNPNVRPEMSEIVEFWEDVLHVYFNVDNAGAYESYVHGMNTAEGETEHNYDTLEHIDIRRQTTHVV